MKTDGHHSCRSGVFIYNFEQFQLRKHSSVFILNFEHIFVFYLGCFMNFEQVMDVV